MQWCLGALGETETQVDSAAITAVAWVIVMATNQSFLAENRRRVYV